MLQTLYNLLNTLRMHEKDIKQKKKQCMLYIGFDYEMPNCCIAAGVKSGLSVRFMFTLQRLKSLLCSQKPL